MGKWLEALGAIDKQAAEEPAKPAKAPFDPFAGSPLELFTREKTRSEDEVEQIEIANAPTNEPAKPAKDPFDPFAGSESNGNHHKTVGSATGLVSHDSTNGHGQAPAKPAKGPDEAERRSDRQAVAKTTSSGNLIAKPLIPANTPGPESPSLTCSCCGSTTWWWNGHDSWYCNRCQANVSGEGGHPITGEEVMRLVVR